MSDQDRQPPPYVIVDCSDDPHVTRAAGHPPADLVVSDPRTDPQLRTQDVIDALVRGMEIACLQHGVTAGHLIRVRGRIVGQRRDHGRKPR